MLPVVAPGLVGSVVLLLLTSRPAARAAILNTSPREPVALGRKYVALFTMFFSAAALINPSRSPRDELTSE